MDRPEEGNSDERWVVIVGFLLIFTPALALVVLLVLLDAFRGLAAGGLSWIELVELYLAEVVVFAVFSYLLYRIGIRGVRRL